MTSLSSAVARRGLTTPALLQLAMAATVALALLTAAVSLRASGVAGQAAQTIGRDAEPSVALGLRMASTLSEIDADALADALGDNGRAVGTSAHFRSGLLRLGDDTIEAARNITYGEAEAAPLRALQHASDLYIEALAQARGTAADSDWIFAQRLKWASRVNRFFAVPQAKALADANDGMLQQIYADYQSSATLQWLGVAATFGSLLVVLATAQVWLAFRTRRLLNPFLLAGSLCVAGGGLWVASAISAERSDLRSAKSDAYDSLSLLFQAKSVAYALKGDVSLWLLAPQTRPQFALDIDQDFRELAATDIRQKSVGPSILKALGDSLAEEIAGRASESAARTPAIGGLLGKELSNITFGVPERQAATDSVTMLMYLAQVIGRVQALEQAGDHGGAVDAWNSERSGGGAEASQLLLAALDRTIDVNQRQFDLRAGAALDSMRLTPWIIGVCLLAGALLSLFGFWLRLRDYR